MSTNVIAGIGTYSFWGLSSSFDVLEAWYNSLSVEEQTNVSENKKIVKILLVNPSDIRHIITTISRKRRKNFFKFISLEFYLVETPVEVLARDLLLLEIFNDYSIPIRQRANIFLEIYGNSKIQERTQSYIETLSNNLRTLFVSKGITSKLNNIIDLTMLKYKEKDDLEECFKSYKENTFPFDIDHYRDYRLRAYYTTRYDSRNALADWDYHESIRSRASIIDIRQYKSWRDNGIAFEFGDQVYSKSNRSLMAYAEGYIKQGKDKGIKKEVKGYWGDIVLSPYYSFGVDSDTPNKFANSLYDIYNKDTGSEQQRHHTVEIAVYNLLSYIYEIEYNSTYQMTIEHDIYSGLGKKDNSRNNLDANVVKVDNIETKTNNDDENNNDDIIEEIFSSSVKQTIIEEEESIDLNSKILENILEAYNNIKIFPVIGPISNNFNKPKYQNYFDIIFISSQSVHLINLEDSIVQLLDRSGLIAVETAKFFIPLSKLKQKQEFVSKIDEYTNSKGLHRISPPVPRRHRDERDIEDDVLFYKF